MIARQKEAREKKSAELEKLLAPSKTKKRGKKGIKGASDMPSYHEEAAEEEGAPESPYKAVLREAARDEAQFHEKCREELADAKRGMMCITKTTITELKGQFNAH